MAPGTQVTFFCETRDATTADFFVNETDVYYHPINGFNASFTFIDHGEWHNTLTTIASPEINNTLVQCLVTGDRGGQSHLRTSNITIASKAVARVFLTGGSTWMNH